MALHVDTAIRLAARDLLLIKSTDELMNNDRAVSRWVSEKLAEPGIPVTDGERAVLDEVLRCMRRVRFGSVQLIVQDGRVIQIDTVEKKRL